MKLDSRTAATPTLPAPEIVQARVAALREREARGDLELLGRSIEDPVQVAMYDAAWADRFEVVRWRIAEALGPAATRIDHVGSTSVPGLDAKPIIDVQVSVPDLGAEDAYAPGLAVLGWPLRMREPDHRFFREPAGERRTTHVHVCALGSEWERRHLLFRDYLRAHPGRARDYGELKLALAERYRQDRVSYTEAKTPFIEETLALAEDWATATEWHI